jgi:hypothetical protein
MYTLQFNVTHALGFSVFTSRILAMDFRTVVIPVCHCSTHEVFFTQSTSFLAISSQSLSTALSRTRPSSLLLSSILPYNHFAPTPRKTPSLLSRIVLGVFTAPLHSSGRGTDHIENSLSVVEACLPSRCLAIGIHVTKVCQTGWP